MGHHWTLKAGTEFFPGRSIPTRIVCEHCGAWVYANRCDTEEAQQVIKRPCPGKS